MVTQSIGKLFEEPKYGDYSFAVEQMKQKIARAKLNFCPITNEMCRPDCVCFIEAILVNEGTGEKPFTICKGGYCNNHSLHGPK